MEGTGANWRKGTYSGSNGGQCVEVANWRKSSHSGPEAGACVEIANTPDGIAIRDTTHRTGPMLHVSPSAWQALTATVREGRTPSHH